MILVLGLACLAWTSPVRADDGAYAVYTGAEPSALASAEVAALLARMDPPVELATPPAHLTTLLDANQIRVVGDARASYCEAQPLDARALGYSLENIQHLLDEVRLEEADQELARLAEVHGCYPLRPGSPDLARESFLAGILAFYRDDLATVGLHFRTALARDPDLPWDEDYPPSAQQWFAQALLEVLRQEPATLILDLPGDAEVWIDGVSQETSSSTIALRPGAHLLHVGNPARGYSSAELHLEPGATAALVSGEALARPDPLGAGTDLVVQLIAGQVAARGLSEAPPGAVVALDDPRSKSTVHPIGPVLLAAGAALAVGGGVMAGTERKQALDLHGDIEGLTRDDGTLDSMLTSFERHRSASYAGWGLLAGGGVCLAAGIPLTLKLRRPVEVTVGVATDVGPEATTWGLQVTVQPGEGRR